MRIPAAAFNFRSPGRWAVTIVVAAGVLVALVSLSAVSSAINRYRAANDVLARLEVEVAGIHGAWRLRVGSGDSIAEEMKIARARVGRLLDSVDSLDPSSTAAPLAWSVGAWLGAPLAQRFDVAGIEQAYQAYASEASHSVDDRTAAAGRQLDERFLGLTTQAIAGVRSEATHQAARLTSAVNTAASLGITVGALAFVGMLWPTDRRQLDGSAETRLMLPRLSEPVLSFDAQGIIRQAEGTVEHALGRPEDTLIDTSLAALVHADDGPAVERFVAQCSKDPKGVAPVEFRPRHVEGVWLAVEAVGGRRRGDSPGEVSIVKLVDVTSRKNAEEALRRSTEVFQTLIDALPLAIIIEDANGDVRLWNAAAERLFGWTADQVLGRANPAVPADALEEHGNLRKRIRDGQAFAGLEARRVKSDGTTLEASVTTAQLQRSDGRGGDVMEVIVDITDRKQLEAQLRQAQKMEAVGRLAGGIAHDFNNLLTVILGHANMLLELPTLPESGDPDEPAGTTVRFGIDQIHQAGQRAAALTQQLLAFSRAQVLQPTVLDLNAAVANMEPMLRRLIGENIDLAVMPGANLESIKADATQIAQVVMNLTLNARDAMPAGGRLTIETCNVELDEVYGRKHVPVIPGSYVMLAVSDTGVGMDKETQARVFEPFFTTKEKGHGTGLGLATVYGIVRQSGGHIWVYSEPRHGTSFKVYLPSVDRRSGAKTVARRTPPALAGSETILLVEDEEMVRALVQHVLARYGYHVLTAHNGEAALKAAARYPGTIDLMLTDSVMPGMSVQDLVRELHAVRPTTKVVYMSGYTDHAVVRNNALDTNRAFIQKPFAPDRLAHKIREMLNQDGAHPSPRHEGPGDGPARALLSVG